MDTRSNFEFVLTHEDNQPKAHLLIRDQCKGGMSVTNDVENVLAFIAAGIEAPLYEYVILYRDSVGQWDRILTDTDDQFVTFEEGPEGEWDTLFELRTK
jgi:hypothetical protein